MSRIRCLSSDGDICYCVDGGISCVAQERLSADCPLFCLSGPGGSLVDGGVIAPPGADAASRDAPPASADGHAD